jgi:hypothetical protein
MSRTRTPTRVTHEVVERARELGVEGDVVGELKRMAHDATPYTDPNADLRHGRFIMRVEGNTVIWIGLADPPRGRRKGSR